MIGILLLLVSCSVAWFVIVLFGSATRKRILMTLACLIPALVIFVPSAFWWFRGSADAYYGIVMSVIVFGFCVAINLSILLIWWVIRKIRTRHT